MPKSKAWDSHVDLRDVARWELPGEDLVAGEGGWFSIARFRHIVLQIETAWLDDAIVLLVHKGLVEVAAYRYAGEVTYLARVLDQPKLDAVLALAALKQCAVETAVGELCASPT